MEEGVPISAWQTCQINQVVSDFPDVFSEIPGTAQGVQHHILIRPGTVVRTPAQRTPLALQDTIERDVQNMLQLEVIEPLALGEVLWI